MVTVESSQFMVERCKMINLIAHSVLLKQKGKSVVPILQNICQWSGGSI